MKTGTQSKWGGSAGIEVGEGWVGIPSIDNFSQVEVRSGADKIHQADTGRMRLIRPSPLYHLVDFDCSSSGELHSVERHGEAWSALVYPLRIYRVQKELTVSVVHEFYHVNPSTPCSPKGND